MNQEQARKATSENNLVPCRFRVMLPILRPTSEGWYLTHFNTGALIIPCEMANDVNTPMSEWELQDFAFQVVRNYIEQAGMRNILSFCDVLQIDPQIWSTRDDVPTTTFCVKLKPPQRLDVQRNRLREDDEIVDRLILKT